MEEKTSDFVIVCVGCLGEAYSSNDCEMSNATKSRPFIRLVIFVHWQLLNNCWSV